MPRDRKKYEIKGKVDLRKIPRGHQPHQSGSGVHKNWRKESRQQTKIALKDEGGRGHASEIFLLLPLQRSFAAL